MRVTSLLLTVWLAATVSALVPHYGRDEAGTSHSALPNTAHQEGDILNVGQSLDSVGMRENQPRLDKQSTTARDKAVVPIHVLGWNITASPQSNTNLSTNETAIVGSDDPAQADIPSLNGYLSAEARVGNERQHVGTLRKDRLENAIYECIKKTCPLDDARRGLNPCTPENALPCHIDNIVYNAEPHDKYATNAYLTVQVEHAYHNPVYPDIGDAVYRAVASLFRLVTDVEESCYDIDFPMSRKTKMCNIPRSASVGFPVNEDHPGGNTIEVQAMAAVQVFFSGPTTEGDYHVGGPGGKFDLSVMDRAKKDWLPRLTKAIGHPDRQLGLRTNYSMPVGVCNDWFWYEDAKCKKD